jgi:L-rhamnonate dehydratase
MRITDVEPILLHGEDAYRATKDGGEAVDNGDWQLLIKVTTDEGLVGWSDVETLASAALACINGPGMSILGFRALKDLLIGEDPLGQPQALWDKMYVGTCYYGRRGVALHCISAIDNCLWSIRAQAAEISLGQLLGGQRRGRESLAEQAIPSQNDPHRQRLPTPSVQGSVTAYASTLFRETPDAMFEAARGYVERGFRAVKFGWGVFGENPARDVELVAAAREALGPGRELMIDPGWYGAGWKGPWKLRTLEENIRLCQSMAPYRVRWIEDFIHPELFDDWTAVRRASPAPLAAGEQLGTIWDFERLIRGGCVDVVQPDLTRCGGLTVALQIARLAEEAKIDLVPHSWLTDLLTAYSLHLISTLSRPLFVEFNVAQSALTRGVCGGALTLNADGTVSIPSGIGLGVEVDEEFIAARRVN